MNRSPLPQPPYHPQGGLIGKSIGFGDIHGPRPYKFIGLRRAFISQTPAARRGSPGQLGRSVGPCKKYWFLGFLSRARGGPGGPGRPPRAIRGPSRGLRGPPGGPRDLKQTKAKNLKELTERWRQGLSWFPGIPESRGQDRVLYVTQ